MDVDFIDHEDVLPSFEMHNYMFNRTIYDAEDHLQVDQAPEYSVFTENINAINGEFNQDSSDTQQTSQFIDPTENPTLLVLNNPNMSRVSIPVNIDIKFTKSSPIRNVPYEIESSLVEYKPGDFITGFVTFTNLLNDPIPFEMMLISLEGDMKSKVGGKIISHQILQSFDLSACYHSGEITLDSQNVLGPQQLDSIDGAFVGFTSRMSIESDMVHKKFFKFKLPKYALDTICPHQLSEHLHLPPTYGFDESAVDGHGENIETPSELGYGKSWQKLGSPLKVLDSALENHSISYFIRCKLIGRRYVAEKLNGKAQMKHNIKEEDKQFVIFKEEKHYVRFDTSASGDIENDSAYFHPFSSTISTRQQLIDIEHDLEKCIYEYQMQRQLKESGVIDAHRQNEMIAEINADPMKKFRNLSTDSSAKASYDGSVDLKQYHHQGSIDISKELFGKAGGKIVIDAKFDKKCQLPSLRPPSLKVRSKNTGPQPTHRDKFPEHHVSLRLKFKPDLEGKKEPPNSITIKPTLKAINISSSKAIPITFDDEFLMDNNLAGLVLLDIQQRFGTYPIKLRELANELNVLIGTYEVAKSLSDISITETSLSKLYFLSQSINISNSWKWDEKEEAYFADVKVPLLVNEKLLRKHVITLTPQFQNCFASLFYMMHLEISMKRGKSSFECKFPINVL
ncbi:hypothetical protein DAMA08_052060 [Martiniozyma asiatica (nom. inval.)]|nr:hypothetical protein DAMA08_052060 [Martiniozyma asiatica]